MMHPIILSAFGLLTLATCQSKNATETLSNSDKTEIKTTSSNSSPKSTPVKTTNSGEPEMSTGMPPDAEAVKVAEKESTAAKSVNGTYYFKEGENKFLKEYEMNVTFKGITEDSRCPKDVNCIWAGVATAEVELMGLSTRPMTIKLSTLDMANKGYSRSQDFNGYSVSLVNLTPETTSAKGYKALKGSYKIALKFEKGAPVDPKMQRGGTTTK